MQKTILKLYLKNSKKPLFTAELLDDGEEILNELVRNLNDENIFVIKFGKVVFNKNEFHHYEIIYK